MSKSIIKKVSPFVALIVICFIVFVELKSINSPQHEVKKETKQEVKVNKKVENAETTKPIIKANKASGTASSITDKKTTSTDTSNTTKSTSDVTKSSNATQTTTPSVNTTTTTTTTITTDPATDTTTTKYLYVDGKLYAKGEKVDFVRSPLSVKVYTNKDGSWSLTGGVQGESAEITTITLKDVNGNLLSTLSQPSDYGVIKQLTFTPKIQGQGTITQSAPLTYTALVLNDGSGNIVTQDTGYVDFEAIPATGWKFKQWNYADHVYNTAKFSYRFGKTQKITSDSYIMAVFVQE